MHIFDIKKGNLMIPLDVILSFLNLCIQLQILTICMPKGFFGDAFIIFSFVTNVGVTYQHCKGNDKIDGKVVIKRDVSYIDLKEISTSV